MSRTRDSQRSAVYAWERAAVPGFGGDRRNAPSLETVEPFVKRVWLSERGRYGLARYPVPALRGGSGSAWGTTGGLKLPPFARVSRAVIVHEIAHALDGSKGYGRGRGGAHGPRFVGIFIGLLARHLGLDAEALMAHAERIFDEGDSAVGWLCAAIGAVALLEWVTR